jgi:dTDP-4-amino-4,6-dideoxygalactose transaminase
MFSFHATKVYNTIEGGAICYEGEDFGKRLYQLKNFGIEGPESVTWVGANAKMNEFQAAMGLCNLRHIETELEKRRSVYERYWDNLSNIEGLQLCEPQKDVLPNYAYFPIMIEDDFGTTRDDVFYRLTQNEIYTRKYFYPITSEFECYQGMFDSDVTPIALDMSRRVLTLPMYADLSLENVDRICQIIRQIKR